MILSKEMNRSYDKGTSARTASFQFRLLQEVGGMLKLVGTVVVPRRPVVVMICSRTA